MASRENNLNFDLECGPTNNHEENNKMPKSTDPSSKTESDNNNDNFSSVFWSRLLNANESVKHETLLPLHGKKSTNYDTGVVMENKNGVDLGIEKILEDESRGGRLIAELAKKNNGKEKHRKNNRKAPKPPRPPKGPSLNASDLKLVKEIADLSVKKRARIEHIKELKKMKGEKATSPSSSSSSTSSLAALIVSILFLLVIIFQGISWRSSGMVQGSPRPETSGNSDFFSVQYLHNLSPSESNETESRFS